MTCKFLSGLGLAVGLCLGVLLVGCGKPNQQSQIAGNTASASSVSVPALRLHWLGKNRLAADTNATKLMDIWNLPASAALESNVLDKLAAVPWRVFTTNLVYSNAPTIFPTALLRPLLDDLLRGESYLEIHGGSNQPTEIILALRLPAGRVALWTTNLPIVIQSLENSILAETHQSSNQLASISVPRFTHSGDWTLLSFTPGTNSALLAQFQKRLPTNLITISSRATNNFIELEGNFFGLKEVFNANWLLPNDPRAFKLLLFGDGENLRTRGWVDFASALNLPLDTWQVPSNLIRQPIVGFSAIRGIKPWLESLSFWKEKQLGSAPNQVFFWSQKSAPWLHFFAVKSPDANRQFLGLKDYVLETINPALAPNRTGSFAWITNESKVVWTGVPFCSPTIELNNDLIHGGFVANPAGNRPMAVELFQQLHSITNLVYYDWEDTGSQVPSWTQISQLMRMAFSYAQLSIKQPGLPWLNAAGPELGFSATTVTLEGGRHLVFARSSTVGFNSTELEILVDWLESPEFPCGLHTLVAPRDFIGNRARPQR